MREPILDLHSLVRSLEFPGGSSLTEFGCENGLGGCTNLLLTASSSSIEHELNFQPHLFRRTERVMD